MGVRAPAGLDLTDLNRVGAVGDVEDAQAPEAVRLGSRPHALAPAVDAPVVGLHRHQQQVADDGDVALAARTDDGGDQLRLGRCLAQAIEVEAVIVADGQQVAREGHVRVGEAEEGRATAELAGRRGGVLVRVVVGRHGGRQAGRIGRVEEAGGLGQAGHQGEVGGRLAGVAEAGLQRAAGIAAPLPQQQRHAVDLGLLLVGDVVDETEQDRVIGRAGTFQQVRHHLHRPLVMGDHEGQELAVELGARGLAQGGQLRRRGHARHPRVSRMGRMIHPGVVRVMHARPRMARPRMAGRRIRRRLAALGQPAAHEGDLVGLGGVDASGDVADGLGVGALLDQLGHLHGLGVVQDHVLHELDVVGGEAVVGDARSLLAVQNARGLTGRAGLKDGRGLGEGGRAGRQNRRGGRGHQDRAHEKGSAKRHGGHPVSVVSGREWSGRRGARQDGIRYKDVRFGRAQRPGSRPDRQGAWARMNSSAAASTWAVIRSGSTGGSPKEARRWASPFTPPRKRQAAPSGSRTFSRPRSVSALSQ